MEKIVTIIAMIGFCISSAVALDAPAENQGMVVEIDYGNIHPSRTVKVPLVKNKTVLEALQAVATVETHPVGKDVFVTSIDGVRGKRGEMAWYYTVDGKPSEELAYSKVLSGTERVKWFYKKDVCSWKVDDKSNQTKEGLNKN